jgi:MFS family permease
MIVYSIGSGLFLSGSIVFFTKFVGLSAGQVGIGLSVAGVVSLVGSVPLGALADKVGGHRMWLPAVIVEALLLGCYPFVRGFAVFLGLIAVLTLITNAGNVGRGRYVFEVVPAEQRVKTLAYQRTALNIGFTVGAGLSGLALSIDTRPAYLALPLGYATLLLVNAFFIIRLPRGERAAPKSGRRHGVRAVFGDRPFLALALVNAIVGMHATIFGAVIPLWIVNRTDAPRALVAWLVTLNTVLVILLQVPFSRGAESLSGAGRTLARAGFALGAGCAVMAVTSVTRGIATIGMLLLANVLVTFAEMLQSSGMWGIGSVVPPAEHRGKYLGAVYMVRQLEAVISPAALVALTVSGAGAGAAGWLILGAFILIGSTLCRPAVSWVGRSDRIGDDSEPPAPVTVAASPQGEVG